MLTRLEFTAPRSDLVLDARYKKIEASGKATPRSRAIKHFRFLKAANVNARSSRVLSRTA